MLVGERRAGYLQMVGSVADARSPPSGPPRAAPPGGGVPLLNAGDLCCLGCTKGRGVAHPGDVDSMKAALDRRMPFGYDGEGNALDNGIPPMGHARGLVAGAPDAPCPRQQSYACALLFRAALFVVLAGIAVVSTQLLLRRPLWCPQEACVVRMRPPGPLAAVLAWDSSSPRATQSIRGARTPPAATADPEKLGCQAPCDPGGGETTCAARLNAMVGNEGKTCLEALTVVTSECLSCGFCTLTDSGCRP